MLDRPRSSVTDMSGSVDAGGIVTGVLMAEIVMADDSTLVAHKSQAQKIKELVAKLAADPKYKKLV